ncbi:MULTISPECIES: hypothetical protein [unclassified Mycolicibacterium]
MVAAAALGGVGTAVAGAGVFVEGPPHPGHMHGDIYTSSYIAAI